MGFFENICNSLSCVDGFAFFIFVFWDEDSLLHRFDTGDVPCPYEFFQDLLIFPCLVLVLFSAVFSDLYADFANSLFFMLRNRLPFLYEGQDFIVFSFVSCSSDASVASAASAMFFAMASPSAAAVDAAAADLSPCDGFIVRCCRRCCSVCFCFCCFSFVVIFFDLIQFCFFDFLLEVSVHQLTVNLRTCLFQFQLGAPCCDEEFFWPLGFRTSPWHICDHFPCLLCRWPLRLCSSSSVFCQSRCSLAVSQHFSECGK